MNSIFHKITVVPGVIGTSDNECEKLESPWRDSALTEIEYKNGSWGPNNIGGIFAYGTCHIFEINGNAGNCLEIKNGNRKKKSI
ncbi:unnamed protein product [Rhizophagus irregularis]|nr:unnamed protein product [Rhizophagus irregularis]